MADPVDIRGLIHLPPDDTRRAFESRGDLQPTVRWHEMWQDDHARAFTVAKVARLDLLETIRASLDRALNEGRTFETWQAELRPELERAGWWGRVQDRGLTGTGAPIQVGPRRLETIFRTNLRVSRAAGQWARIQERKDVAPYLRYSAVMDRRTRPLHRAWHGTILPVDHPWWAEHFPPNGWNCRCTGLQLSARELERNGWRVSEVAELRRAEMLAGARPSRFKRAGGEIVQVPPGIDPGWAYNPGAASFRAIAAKAARSLDELAAAVTPAAALDELADLARNRSVRVVHTIGVAGEESQEAVRGFSRQISSEEVRHALAGHGIGGRRGDRFPVTPEDIRLIPAIIRDGVRIDQVAKNNAEQVWVLRIGELYYIYVERIGRKRRRLMGRTLFKVAELPPNYRGVEG